MYYIVLDNTVKFDYIFLVQLYQIFFFCILNMKASEKHAEKFHII